MTVCFYIRLSSADDDIRLKAESDSVSNQRALLMQYLASRPELSGYKLVEFVDDGFSGTNGDRPAFERMIRFVRDGGSKLIICKDLSRFFRDICGDRRVPGAGVPYAGCAAAGCE